MKRNLRGKKMDIEAWYFLAYGFLQLGSAWSIDCTASHSSPFSEQTTYSLSDNPHLPDVTLSDCLYIWAKDNYVLAHHIDSNPELVVRHSINHLITPTCFDNISFARNCISEGNSHTVHCQPNCTLLALVRSQKQKEIPVTADATADATAGANVRAGVVAAVILLAGFLCVCLGYKFKDNISRMFNRSHPTCLYTDVKKQNGDPSAAEEEEENV